MFCKNCQIALYKAFIYSRDVSFLQLVSFTLGKLRKLLTLWVSPFQKTSLFKKKFEWFRVRFRRNSNVIYLTISESSSDKLDADFKKRICFLSNLQESRQKNFLFRACQTVLWYLNE